MDNSSILAKTRMAKDEILKRDFGLPAEMRRLLIVVDGKRTIGQIISMLPNLENINVLLEDLEGLGFVEFVGSVESANQMHYVESGGAVRVSGDNDSRVYEFPKEQQSAPVTLQPEQVKPNQIRHDHAASDTGSASPGGLREVVEKLKGHMQTVLGEEYGLVATKIDNCESFGRLASVMQGCEKILSAYHGPAELNAFRQNFKVYF